MKLYKIFQFFTYNITITEYFKESLESLVQNHRKTWSLFPENDIKRWFFQILSALKPCHDRGKYHGGLSLSTILISNNNNAYLDYNFSSNKGKNGYKAPELYDRGEYSISSDIWSLGVILYLLVNLTPPFSAISDIYTYVFNPDLEFSQECSSDIFDIIRLCLSVHPLERPTVDDLLAIPCMQEQYLHGIIF